jgi:hypothetical protein
MAASESLEGATDGGTGGAVDGRDADNRLEEGRAAVGDLEVRDAFFWP